MVILYLFPHRLESFRREGGIREMQPLRGVQTKLECGFRGLGSSFKAQDAGERGSCRRKRAAKRRSKSNDRNFDRYWFIYSSPETGETPLSHTQRKQPHLCTPAWLFRGKTHLLLLLNSYKLL